MTTPLPPTPPSYWGDATSNINWCEPDFVQSPYIAEFWNTISSIPIAIFGLIGIYTTMKYSTYCRDRYLLSYFGLVIVGIGSMAFHATLRRSAQAADELPMLFTAAVLLYNALAQGSGFSPSNKRNAWSVSTWVTHMFPLKCLLFVLLAVFIAIYFYFPEFFILFFVGYGGFVSSFTIICGVSIFRSASIYSRIPRVYFILACLFYFGGFACWTFENLTCSIWFPTHFYLHSVWHCAAGVGVFTTIQCQISWQAEYHGATAKQLYTYIPLVEIVVKNKREFSGNGNQGATVTRNGSKAGSNKH